MTTAKKPALPPLPVPHKAVEWPHDGLVYSHDQIVAYGQACDEHGYKRGLEVAAKLFDQPYREYFGIESQEMIRELAAHPTEQAAQVQEAQATSIRDHADFVEDVLRLSEHGVNRKTLQAIRKDIYDTIDARVANAVRAALASRQPVHKVAPSETVDGPEFTKLLLAYRHNEFAFDGVLHDLIDYINHWHAAGVAAAVNEALEEESQRPCCENPGTCEKACVQRGRHLEEAARQAQPVRKLTDEQSTIIAQGAEMLRDYAEELDKRGVNSSAEGAKASAYAIEHWWNVGQPVREAMADGIDRRTDDIRMRLANPTSIPRSMLLHYAECLLAHIKLLQGKVAP